MLVFTLPSYPYVFKVIKDVFGHGKDTDRATVRAKFAMVKHVDRVGRMADTLEFTDLALPRDRFAPELLAELRTLAPSMIEDDGEPLIIRHCYVERRMMPLNIFLDRATPDELERAVVEYGNAIRDLADREHLPRRHALAELRRHALRPGRLLRLRRDRVPDRRQVPQDPAAAEPRGGAGERAVVWRRFPTTSFRRSSRRSCSATRACASSFMRHHADLLEPEFWQECQRRIEAGEIVDFFPYPESLRFSRPSERI